MSEWGKDWDGKTERRTENNMLVEQHKTMMALLTSMDKNLALAVQRLETQTVVLDTHIKEDKAVQKELGDGQVKINNKLSWYAGALAALIGACTLILKVGK